MHTYTILRKRDGWTIIIVISVYTFMQFNSGLSKKRIHFLLRQTHLRTMPYLTAKVIFILIDDKLISLLCGTVFLYIPVPIVPKSLLPALYFDMQDWMGYTSVAGGAQPEDFSCCRLRHGGKHTAPPAAKTFLFYHRPVIDQLKLSFN